MATFAPTGVEYGRFNTQAHMTSASYTSQAAVVPGRPYPRQPASVNMSSTEQTWQASVPFRSIETTRPGFSVPPGNPSASTWATMPDTSQPSSYWSNAGQAFPPSTYSVAITHSTHRPVATSASLNQSPGIVATYSSGPVSYTHLTLPTKRIV